MSDQFSNMSFQNEGLIGHMSFQVEKIISSTGFIGSKFGCAMMGLTKSFFPDPHPNHLDGTQS